MAYKWTRFIVSALFVAVFLPIVGQFFIELAAENGFYDSPTEKVLAVTNFFNTITSNYWFWAAFWFLCGSTGMAWLGYCLRWGGKKEIEASNVEVITESAHPLDTLIENCKEQDPSYMSLPLTPEIFFEIWIKRLNSMQALRNVYDLNNLLRSSGRVLVIESGQERAGMVAYVINSLERNGYIQTGQTDEPLQYGQELSTDGNNISITFTDKWSELENVHW